MWTDSMTESTFDGLAQGIPRYHSGLQQMEVLFKQSRTRDSVKLGQPNTRSSCVGRSAPIPSARVELSVGT